MTHEEARARFVAAKAPEGVPLPQVWALVYEVQEIAQARKCCESCYAWQIQLAERACEALVLASGAEGG
ncbi:MAG: hypothetical protein Q8R78_00695 [Candidatus Omnitrophota bacterium]|nr:hypothetical protein [Candidatus Omnitrophota bacterium]